MFDFDQPMNRYASGSIKWQKYAGRDILPMWVADMDFAAPPAVIGALQQHLQQGDLGYAHPPATLAAQVADFIATTHGWRIDPDWIVWLPGLVCGLNLACRAFGAAGVATLTPVYPPFLSAPQLAGQTLTRIDMLDSGNGWQIDFAQLRARLRPQQLLLLCNPHNPVGRAYNREELQQLAQLAAEFELTICSDEIHADLMLDAERPHLPIAALDADTGKRTLTLMAPSKTFNMPGLGSAFAIAESPAIRARLKQVMAGIVPHPNSLAWPAMAAAYQHSRDWRLALLDYLRGNRDLLQQAIAALPPLKMHPVQATYLAWIDCRALGGNPQAYFEAHGLGLSDGADFGAPGFVRLNFGCRRELLQQAITRLQQALKSANWPMTNDCL